MRAALVRATGRRESANDPVFGGLITDAPKYVQSYDRGPQGELQVLFNAAALEKAIASLDRSTWDPNRPFTIIVLNPPPDQADQATYQASLAQDAGERGLPISIVPLPVTDSSGNLLSREALLQMAHRYGADQLLVGRPPAPTADGLPAAAPAAAPSAPAADWRWTLYTDFTSPSWNGALTAGIDGTVDLLAPPAGAAAAGVSGPTEIEIEGVSSLADYANIEQMLGAVPGVSKANVRQISGDSVVFDLTVRGGGAAIEQSLSSSPSFARVGPSAPASGPLIYRYRPG